MLLAVMLAVVSCGGRDQPDDQALHKDIVQGLSGAEVTFNASVTTEPVDSGGHERFEVNDASGDLLEIDHNTTLAAAVPAHQGDQVVIRGQLYIDPGAAGVHCTHAHTSRGCPDPGFVKLGSQTYE